jgi:hypothetical protein
VLRRRVAEGRLHRLSGRAVSTVGGGLKFQSAHPEPKMKGRDCVLEAVPAMPVVPAEFLRAIVKRIGPELRAFYDAETSQAPDERLTRCLGQIDRREREQPGAGPHRPV